jgi:hypothetical protein
MTMPDRDDRDDLIDEVVADPTAAIASVAAAERARQAQRAQRAQRPYAPPEAPGELADRIDDSLDEDRTAAVYLRRMFEGLALAAAGLDVNPGEAKRGLAQAASAAHDLAVQIEEGVARGETVAARMREAFPEPEPEEEVPE